MSRPPGVCGRRPPEGHSCLMLLALVLVAWIRPGWAACSCPPVVRRLTKHEDTHPTVDGTTDINVHELEVKSQAANIAKAVRTTAPPGGRAWGMGVVILLLNPAMAAVGFLYAGRAGRGTGEASALDDYIDTAAMDNHTLPITMTFIDESKEERYVIANATKLCDSAIVVSLVVSLYSFYTMMFTYDIRAMTVLKPILRRWDSSARVVFNCSWITIFVVGLLTAGMIQLCKRDRRKKHMDVVLGIWVFIVLQLAMFSGNRYNAAAIFRDDPRKTFTHFDSDSTQLMNLLTVILFVTLYIPIRFCILAPALLTLTLMYPIQSIWLGSPDGGLWTIAFGYPNPQILGEMGFMDLGMSAYFFGIVLMILCGQRQMEHKRRHDFNTIEASALLIQELQTEDTEKKGSSQLQRATKALESAEGGLGELESNRAVVKAGLAEEVKRLRRQIHVAQKTLGNADRLFHVNVQDVLNNKDFEAYRDDKEIHAFVAMTGAQREASESVVLSAGNSALASNLFSLRNTGLSRRIDQFVQRSPSFAHVTKALDGIGSDWDFDPFALARETGNCALLHLGDLLIVKALWRGALMKESVTERELRKFIREIHRRYPANDYHNEVHATTVAHMALWFATETGFIDGMANDMERMGLMVAAVCHDVGHIGRNNLFLVNAKHTAALMWNDSAVLENMHASVCFVVSEKPGCGIFDACSSKEKANFRRFIIDLILATDLKSHNESIAKYNQRREADDFLTMPGIGEGGMQNSDRWQADKLMLAKMIMQSSDIGHAGLPWDMHQEWSLRVVAEFFAQGDEEKRIGIPVSPLCERAGYNIVNNQGFFIDYIAKSCLVQLEGSALDQGKEHIRKEVLDRCEENKDLWKTHYASGFDSANHCIKTIEQGHGKVCPAILPYEHDLTKEPLDLVPNERLLAEVGYYRSTARNLPPVVPAPQCH